jgi:hypothetical protein
MAEQKGEEKKSCVVCKKPVKRVRRYYRDGKYYCNINCWKKSKTKAAETPGA